MKMVIYKNENISMEDIIKRLKDGEIINVIDASSFSYGLCIGDFREYNMSVRCTDKFGMWWEWKGPGTICINGVNYKPNTETKYVEMDWE
jgi:hypothetical protein